MRVSGPGMSGMTFRALQAPAASEAWLMVVYSGNYMQLYPMTSVCWTHAVNNMPFYLWF